MLPFENRLIQKKDFQDVFRKGKFFSFGSFSIKFAKNGLKKTRIGVAVGLKFSQKAVERNRIKRQIREILKKKISDVRPGFDVVVMPRGNQEKRVDRKNLEIELVTMLGKSGLILKSE